MRVLKNDLAIFCDLPFHIEITVFWKKIHCLPSKLPQFLIKSIVFCKDHEHITTMTTLSLSLLIFQLAQILVDFLLLEISFTV